MGYGLHKRYLLPNEKPLTWDGTYGVYHIAGTAVGLTPLGGHAVRMVNGSGGTLAGGTLVCPSNTALNACMQVTDEFDTIAVTLGSIPNGQAGWVSSHGPVNMRLQAGSTAILEGWVKASVDPGLANASFGKPAGAGIPEATDHFREVGHSMSNTTNAAIVFMHTL